MNNGDFVIHVGADTAEAVRKMKALEKLNAKMANSLGKNYVKATRIMSTSLDKVSQTSGIKKVGKEFQNVTTEIFNAGTVIKTADGKYKNFVETLTFTNGKLKSTKGALTDVSKKYDTHAQNVKKLTKAQQAVAKATTKVNKLQQQYNKTMSTGSKHTKTFAENVGFLAKRAILVIPLWLALRGAIMGVINVFKNGMSDIISFDRVLQKARQNLQGTPDDIERNFKRLKERVKALSIETGTSVQDITLAFQKFATTGLGFEEAWAGAEVSTKSAIVLFGDTIKFANSLARTYRVLGKSMDKNKTPMENMMKNASQLKKLWDTNAFTLDEFSGAIERFAPTANSLKIPLEKVNVLLATLHTSGLRGTRTGRLLSSSFIKMVSNLKLLTPMLGITIDSSDGAFEAFRKIIKAIKELNDQSKLSQDASEAINKIFGGKRSGESVRALIAIHDTLERNLKLKGSIEDFNKTLDDLTNTVSKQADIFKNLKKEASRAFMEGLTGADNFADSIKTINSGMKKVVTTGGIFGEILGTLAKYNVLAPIGGVLEDLTKISAKAEQIHSDIKDAFQGKLNVDELIKLLARIKVGMEDSTVYVDRRTIHRLKKKLVEIKTNLKKDLEKDGDINIKTKVKLSVSQEQSIGEEILKLELNRLKLNGALESQQIIAERNLVKQLGLYRTNLDIIKKELEYQYALTNEKKKQTKVESDTIKLMKVAQQYGVKSAKRVGELLAGNIDLSDFSRRYEAELKIVEKDFKSFYENAQALQWARGEKVTGFPSLRGGTSVTIPDEFIRQKPSTIDSTVALRQAKAQMQLLRMESNIQVKVEAKLDPNDLSAFADKIGKSVAEGIETKGTEINDAVNKAINDY